jgi:hypothetical protein
VRRVVLMALMAGAAHAALVISPAFAQAVQTDQNGFSPFNTKSTLDENVNTSVVRNAPALGLSSIYGLNPCSLGASAGVTTPLFGIAGAISTTDKGCETRNTAALAITGLKDEVAAREIMCDIPEFRDAVKRIGKPCLADQQQAATQPAPTASRQPNVQSVAATTTEVATKETVSPDAPAWCHTPGLMLATYPECTNPTHEAVHEGKHKPVKQVAAPTPAKEPPDDAPEVRATQETVASKKPSRHPVPSPETHSPVVASICSVRLYAPGCPSPVHQTTGQTAVAHVVERPAAPPTAPPMVAAICGVKLYAPGCPGGIVSTVEDQPKPRVTAER